MRASAGGFLGATTGITVTSDSTTTVNFSLQSDQVWAESNSASYLSLLAPGANINSSVPGGGFDTFSGTSMAAPHVAGAWAILKQKKPEATVGQILNALQTTGVKITETRPGANNRVHCRIQIDQALNNIPEKQVILPIPNAEAMGINNCGQIVGTQWDAAGNSTGFITDSRGAILTNFAFGDSYTDAFSINNKGEVHGTYCCDSLGFVHGFFRDALGAISTVGNPNTKQIYGSNDHGDMVGEYWIGSPEQNNGFSFFVFTNGTPNSIDNIVPEDINNMRRWIGIGPVAADIGVVVSENGDQVTFGPPDSESTRPFSINESGWIVGCWGDSSFPTNWHGFIRKPDGTLTSYDYPGSPETCLQGINDSGQMVGSRWDVPFGDSGRPFIDMSW